MREIKFRAWEKNLKFMMPIEEIDFVKEIVNKNGVWRLFGEIELMQYTGLKDKNGVEIYEGDILKCTSKIFTNFGKTDTGKYDEAIKQVIWMDDSWGTRVLTSVLTRKGAENKGLKITVKYGGVIGNIYENPDLLETKKSS